MLTLDDEDTFVEKLMSGLTAYPHFYAHMAPINLAGPSDVDLSAPGPVDPVEIRRRIHAGEWIVDLRSRTVFASGHLGIDVDAQIILGACNPQLAHRALEIDPRVATLLPCNVVVRTENGHTVVEALDPKIIAEVPGNAALAPIAEEAGQRIQAALDALGSA